MICNTTDKPMGGMQPALMRLAERYAWYLEVEMMGGGIYSPLDEPAKPWWKPTYIEGDGAGEMMSPIDALRCLVDWGRTTVFAKGIKDVVMQLRATTNDPLAAIDAGSGTGILSILMAAQGVEQITAIELNPMTARISRRLVKELGMSEQITILDGDATAIRLPESKAQIFVSETLSGGLTDEPHAKILAHLSQYIAPDAYILPRGAKLNVSLGWADWAQLDEGLNIYRTMLLPDYSRQTHITPCFRTVFDPTTVLRRIRSRTQMRRLPNGKDPIATIDVATSFVMSKYGHKERFIHPDLARFLGSTTSFRVEGINPKAEEYAVEVDYAPGCKKRDIGAFAVNDTTILLTDQKE